MKALKLILLILILLFAAIWAHAAGIPDANGLNEGSVPPAFLTGERENTIQSGNLPWLQALAKKKLGSLSARNDRGKTLLHMAPAALLSTSVKL